MGRCVLAWDNLVDEATLSASGESGDLTASNMANPIVGRRWRGPTNTAWGQADFGSDQTVEIVGLVFPRDSTLMGAAETVQHQFDAHGGTPGTGTVHDSGAIASGVRDGYGYHVYVPAAAVTARYWRFTFNAPSLSVIDVGRAWAGPKWQPARNFEFEREDRWDDLSRVVPAVRSGAEYVDPRARQRMMAFELANLSNADRDQAREAARSAGLANQVLFVTDPDSADLGREAILGRLIETRPIRQLHPVVWALSFAIRESL